MGKAIMMGLALLLTLPAWAEPLADQPALLFENGRLPRELLLERLQQVRFAFREMPAPGQRPRPWLRGYGLDGDWDAGASTLAYRTSGVALGVDRELGGQWMGGLLLALEQADADEEAASLGSDNRYLGLYATTRVYNQLGFKLGLLHAWHRLDARRWEMGQRLDSETRGRSLQLFGEASYAMDFREFSLSPFAGLSWQRGALDGFGEQGGSAARYRAGSHWQRSQLDLGWRLNKPWTLEHGRLAGRASLTLQLPLGEQRGAVTLFDAAGEPQRLPGRHSQGTAVRLGLSLDRELGGGRSLGLGYSGRFAEWGHEQALIARVSLAL